MLEALVILAILAALKGASGEAPPKPPPKTTTASGSGGGDNTVGDGLAVAKTGAALAGTAVSVAGSLVALFGGGGSAAGGGAAAAAGGAAASGGASGAASGATAAGSGVTNTAVDAAAAGTTVAEVGSESVGVVAAEGGIVIAAVIAVGVAVATLATTEAHGATVAMRASLGVSGLKIWLYSRIHAIETDLLKKWVQALGGSVSGEFDASWPLVDPRYQQWTIRSVLGLRPATLAAAASAARYAACEQTREWARAVNYAVRWDLEHSDNWGSKVLTDADVEAMGWALSEAHVGEAIAEYYQQNNPTSFGLQLTNGSSSTVKSIVGGTGRSPLLASSSAGTVGSPRTLTDDAGVFALIPWPPPQGQAVPFLAYHRWIGRLSAVDFMLSIYQPFAGVHEPFTGFMEDLSNEYDARSAYAGQVRYKYGWTSGLGANGFGQAGPFLIDLEARQAFDPSQWAASGQFITYALDPRTDAYLVNATAPGVLP